MHKMILFLSSCFLMTSLSFAQTTPSSSTSDPATTAPLVTNWTSKDASDVVTIHNGNGNMLTISITVNKPTSNSQNTSSNTAIDPPGITIDNCGETTRIAAGSSAVCTTNDAANPVSFRADSQTGMASGTYTIRQVQ